MLMTKTKMSTTSTRQWQHGALLQAALAREIGGQYPWQPVLIPKHCGLVHISKNPAAIR